MSSHEVDGVTLPDPVAGHPALDFCNTRAGWNAEQPKEYLVDPGVLAVWVGEAGLLPIEDAVRLRSKPWPAGLLERALALREALYPVLLGRGTASDWSVVSQEAALARGRARLVPGDMDIARLSITETPASGRAPRTGSAGSPTAGADPADTRSAGARATDTRAALAHAPRTPAAGTRAPGGGAVGPAHWQPIWSGPETALHVIATSAADFLTSPRSGSVGACPGEGCGWLFTDPRGRRRWCSMAVCGNRAKARRFRDGR